jgi:cinnamoyl-CoA:phenyllactate CoA-transferase
MLRTEADNPFNNAYKTADGRFIQISMPPVDVFYPRFMPLIGREDLVGEEKYKINNIMQQGLNAEFIAILDEAFAKKTAGEWTRIFTEADIPFAVAATWEEVLEDKQAWAIGAFEAVDYPTGKRTMVHQPIELSGADKLSYTKAPLLGEHSEEVLAKLGYTAEQLKALHESGVYSTWDDLRGAVGG